MAPGVFTVDGMGLQFPPGSIVETTDANGQSRLEVNSYLLRLDLWPTWLEIGCSHAGEAAEAANGLGPEVPDVDKGELLSSELRAGIVAITAFAFAFDSFYDVIQKELGEHPDATSWREPGRRPTSRHIQVAETLRYRLKLGPNFSRQVRQCLRELYRFRDRAVHSTSKYIEPNYRPEIDSAVHPHFITFSGPHAIQCRAMSLELLNRFVERARDIAPPNADPGWLDKGRKELDRLIPLYRVPGDDMLAFPTTATVEAGPTGSDAADADRPTH